MGEFPTFSKIWCFALFVCLFDWLRILLLYLMNKMFPFLTLCKSSFPSNRCVISKVFLIGLSSIYLNFNQSDSIIPYTLFSFILVSSTPLLSSTDPHQITKEENGCKCRPSARIFHHNFTYGSSGIIGYQR